MTESERRVFSPSDIRKGFHCFSNMGVAGVMKEVKLSRVLNATSGFLQQSKWQMMKQDTFPLLLILLPSLSHPQWQLDFTNGTGFRSPFAHLPQYTLFAPQTFSIRIVFNFSWEDYNTQEKLKTKVMQNLGDKQGVLHKRYANGKCRFRKAESIFTLLLNRKPHSYSW